MRTLIAKDLSEVTFQKLKKWKETSGFKDKSWSEFLDFAVADIRLDWLVPEKITQITYEVLMELWCENFALNLPYIRSGKAINDLEEAGKGKAAIVIGSGPSLQKNKHLEMLAESDFDGVILLCDGILKQALKAEVTPEKFPNQLFVGSVDGNRELIWKHYDDPIVDKHGSGIKGLFTTMAAPNARERAEKAGIDIYWYNPTYDDWRKNESFTRLSGMMTKTESKPKGIACLKSGGNIGSSLAIISFSVFNANPTCLLGIDMGYLDGTPIEETPYYEKILKAAKGNVSVATKFFRRVYNPYFKCYCLVDFVFDSYRTAWLDLASKIPIEYITINCSQGGCLFGEPYIYCMKFAEFLQHYKDENLLDYCLKV